eukprot:2200869-Pyramimonas_sp.AAC.1
MFLLLFALLLNVLLRMTRSEMRVGGPSYYGCWQQLPVLLRIRRLRPRRHCRFYQAVTPSLLVIQGPDRLP